MIQPNSLSLNAQQLLEQFILKELPAAMSEQLRSQQAVFKPAPPTSAQIKTRLSKFNAQKVAQLIYDAKGIFSDDENVAIEAIKQNIKNIKQYTQVTKELQKLTGGRGIGAYLQSFTTVADRLNIASYLADILPESQWDWTIKKIFTFSDVKTYFGKTDYERFGRGDGENKFINNMIMDPRLYSNEFRDYNKSEFFISQWLNDHDTWDSFINGPQGLRDAVFDWKGIIITTILAYTPLKPVEMVIFALLVIDDIKRFSEQGFQWDILLELVFDVIGLLIGGAAKWIQTGLKATLKPIGKGLLEIFEKLVANGGVRKLIERLIKLILPYAERLAKSKIGQLIAKLGGKIGNLIARVVESAKSALKSLIGAFLNIANKLKGTKFYKKAMAIVKMLSTVTKWIVGSFIDAIKWIFKTIWAVVSFPGKSIAWILEKLGFKAAAPIGKLVFNNGAMAYIFQNHAKWMDAYREKTGVYKRDELIDVALHNGFATFKQQNEEHVAKTTKGEYVKLKVTDEPWLFVIVESKGKWTEIIMDDGISLWVKTAEITEKYGEVQQ
jgi:hypothetical protein